MTNPTPARRSLAGPDHRDLYVLCIGVLAGILCGPGVQNHIAPARYERFFVGAADEHRQFVNAHEDMLKLEALIPPQLQALDAQIDALRHSGVSEAAVQEQTDRAKSLRQDLHNALLREAINQSAYAKALADYAAYFAGLLNALVLVCLAVMVLETLIDPAAPPPFLRLRGSLASIRYACMAAWVGLVIAQPQPLHAVPLLLVLLLLLVGLVIALVPFRRAPAD